MNRLTDAPESKPARWQKRWRAYIQSPRSSRLMLVAGGALVVLSLGCVLLFTGCGGDAPAESDGDTTEATPALTPAEQLEASIQSTIDGMTAEQKAAQLFFVAPEALTGVATAIQAGDATREALADRPVGGIVYFQQNLVDAEQTKEMLSNTQAYAQEALADVPIFLAVDEEGGTVSRIGGNPGFAIDNVGDMASVGATLDTAKAKDVAITIADYLDGLGFNTDFAPVADVATNAAGTMTSRSFGAEPTLVASMVKAQVEGFLSQGMLCAAKHFPGIGGVAGDSHSGAIVSDKTLEAIEETELGPFKAAIEAGVPFVMVGHLQTPQATGDDLPASLSSIWIKRVLRDKLGFDGVVITDSLTMDAVSQRVGADRVGVEALLAGNDMLLMPEDFEAAYNGVLSALDSGELSMERIDESLHRILTLKLRDLAPAEKS